MESGTLLLLIQRLQEIIAALLLLKQQYRAILQAKNSMAPSLRFIQSETAHVNTPPLPIFPFPFFMFNTTMNHVQVHMIHRCHYTG